MREIYAMSLGTNGKGISYFSVAFSSKQSLCKNGLFWVVYSDPLHMEIQTWLLKIKAWYVSNALCLTAVMEVKGQLLEILKVAHQDFKNG